MECGYPKCGYVPDHGLALIDVIAQSMALLLRKRVAHYLSYPG
jgi:hypothetical protein